VQQVKKTTKTI